MLIGTDQPETPTSPELLIEEARQRQRVRRRAAALIAVGLLAAVGFGIYRVAQGNSADTATPGAAAVAADPKPKVLYRKIETIKIVPHLPVERRTVEIWSATNAPLAYRELVKTTGQPSLEIGASATQDPDLGTLQAVYLYQPSSNTIYRTGAMPAPPQSQPPSMSPPQAYRHLIAQPGVHLAGTRSLYGHTVHVVRASPIAPGVSATFYIDQDTYMPIMIVQRSADLTSIRRVVARKTLPATEANLKLTALTKAHPGARIRPQTPRIKAIYGQATLFDNVSPDGVSVGGL